MTSRSHRSAALLACLLTLAASLAHPLIAYGGSVCVAESHVAVDMTPNGAPSAAAQLDCHPSVPGDHEPCVDMDLGGSHTAMSEVGPRSATAPSFASTPALAALAPPLAAPAADGRPLVIARAPDALTHLDLRVLTI